jgi:hypothetical protein
MPPPLPDHAAGRLGVSLSNGLGDVFHDGVLQGLTNVSLAGLIARLRVQHSANRK